MARRTDRVHEIANRLIEVVPTEVQADLRSEDPRSAIEVYFDPVGVRELPEDEFASSDCSVDGFYDPYFDPQRPWIFVSSVNAAARIRFTLLHELAHHLLATTGAELLDDIDRLATGARSPAQVEEEVCHRFAGNLLVPDQLLHDAIGSGPLKPVQIIDLHNATQASWEAVAVRAAGWMGGVSAVCLVRTAGEVAFVASNGLPPWKRGSSVSPGGALANGLAHGATARQEIYRYEQAYSRQLFCDVKLAHPGLAVGVLSERRSDGEFGLLEQSEPIWKEREEFCRWCSAERSVDWCDLCRGRLCRDCGRCGCGSPVENPLCPTCDLRNPFNAGSRVCRDCEADGRG